MIWLCLMMTSLFGYWRAAEESVALNPVGLSSSMDCSSLLNDIDILV